MHSKEHIKQACIKLIEQRIITAETAMRNAQESSNSEDKSSAGDKYETARAMGQIARDMNAKQLMQAQLDMNELQKLDIQPTNFVKKGALVKTPQATYFIALGLGAIQMPHETITVISPKSPLGSVLMGKKAGETYSFNNQNINIEHIW